MTVVGDMDFSYVLKGRVYIECGIKMARSKPIQQ